MIRSKSFSSSFALLAASLTLFGCYEQIPAPSKLPPLSRNEGRQNGNINEVRLAPIAPPWNSSSPSRDPELQQIEALIERGQLQAALNGLEKNIASDPYEVTLRRSSVLLQVGRSKEALEGISKFVSDRKSNIEKLPPEMTLIAAYAYKHEKDINQTMAWLGLTIRSDPSSSAARIATKELESLLTRISNEGFEKYSGEWNFDQTVRPFFAAERARRNAGGEIVRSPETDYYSEITYLQESGATTKTDSLLSLKSTAALTVIVPQKRLQKEVMEFRNGVELAHLELKSVLTDPTANSEIKYIPEESVTVESLEGAPVVLGPFQSKTLENLSPREALLFSFSTRPVSGIQRVVFFAVSPVDEARELVHFALEEEQYQRPLLVVSDTLSPESYSKLQAFGEKVKVVRIAQLRDDGSFEQTLGDRDVLLGLFAIDGAEQLLQKIREARPNLPFVGANNWFDQPIIRSFVALFEGTRILLPYFADGDRPTVKDFVSRYKARFGNTPGLWSAIGYDAARITLLPANEKSMELPLELGDLKSVTGVLRIDKEGRTYRNFELLQVQSGEILELRRTH